MSRPCRQCAHPNEKGLHTCGPQGVSSTFRPSTSHGPPLVMLYLEEYDRMRDVIERLERCLDVKGARIVEGWGVVDALNAYAECKKLRAAQPERPEE